jgi:hypothetical protein
MVKIVVPKPAKGSFNKQRPASDLLKSQLKHLHALEKSLPHRLQTGRNVEEISTEGDASAYIKKVTSRLHPRGRVKVPRPAPGSFHKHRPVSDLLKRQVEHFHEAERHLPVGQQTGIHIDSIRLEHEAAAYIGKVTAALHAQPRSDARAAEERSAFPPSGTVGTTKRAIRSKEPTTAERSRDEKKGKK